MTKKSDGLKSLEYCIDRFMEAYMDGHDLPDDWRDKMMGAQIYGRAYFLVIIRTLLKVARDQYTSPESRQVLVNTAWQMFNNAYSHAWIGLIETDIQLNQRDDYVPYTVRLYRDIINVAEQLEDEGTAVGDFLSTLARGMAPISEKDLVFHAGGIGEQDMEYLKLSDEDLE